MNMGVASPSTWMRWRDTHLQAPLWLFKATVKDADYEALLAGKNRTRRSFRRKLAQRILWFWPRIDDASRWAEAEEDGYWSPKNYLRENPTRPAQRVMDVLPRSEALLELACNSGCDLNFLYRAGFVGIKAVDVSGTALAKFKEIFPKAWESSSISHDLLQRYLLAQASKSVGTIYSNGAAIELVHPSFPVVKQMCRVARHGVILELNPKSAGYPRDYLGQFHKEGFRVAYTTEKADGNSASHLYHFIAK
mgnify:CR=1 FL=1